MIIRPTLSNGAKTALRVPITICASPFLTRLYSSSLSPRESALWKTAILSPNRFVNRATNCGVSDISGTITMIPFPSPSTRSISFMNTLVLPEPVTP